MKGIHFLQGVSVQSAAAPIGHQLMNRQWVDRPEILIGKDVLEIEQETQIKNSSSGSGRLAIALEIAKCSLQLYILQLSLLKNATVTALLLTHSQKIGMPLA